MEIHMDRSVMIQLTDLSDLHITYWLSDLLCHLMTKVIYYVTYWLSDLLRHLLTKWFTMSPTD